ncbi:PQQ-binding-like beta-propeller repeat protein [Halosimplex pelagicum]|uniref:PQQ-binding-like beta-propeller repeat protein n=1 Tax=Halosimplex pelagicum TaxID=869886 RepID=A0A7D5TAG4_9EURY|nr:PQQ-binding-like beta-propeller repeat protein [Halosimplex pelagicum]QLH81369.1 PQQ-binding-like beta-propeller repeat protein [Halosimplex pelagicum]
MFFEPTGEAFVDGETIYVGSRDGVRAVATTDGTQRWQTDQDRISLIGATDTTALYYASFLESGVYRANLQTGAVESSSDFGPVGGPPAVTDEVIVVGTDYNAAGEQENELVGLSKSGLNENWSVTEVGRSYTGGIGYGDQAIVGFGMGDQPRIESRDPVTGELNWAVNGYVTAPIRAHEDTLYVPIAGDGVELLKIAPDGTVAWRHLLEERRATQYVYTAAPAFHDGRAYLASYHQLHALDIQTGEVVWTAQTDNPLESTPAIVGDYVWVAPTASSDEERNRTLLGFEIETGEQQVQTQFAASTQGTFELGSRLGVRMENQLVAFSVEA